MPVPYPQSLNADDMPSAKTYADAPSGQTIGQWGFIQNASGFSIFYSSGKSIYYFGGSTLSGAQP